MSKTYDATAMAIKYNRVSAHLLRQHHLWHLKKSESDNKLQDMVISVPNSVTHRVPSL